MTAPILLHADGVVRRHGGLVAVDRVDLVVRAGQVVGVVGPNGAGKSTLLDCLAGSQPLDGGSVHLGDRDITASPPHERARLGLVRTFQRAAPFASLTVQENLLVAAENRQARGLLRGALGLPDPGAGDARRTTQVVLDRVGIGALADVRTADLPTGTLRLVELARALCSDPAVLLLDEPASGLGERETEQLAGLVTDLAADGLGLVLVEHDLRLVRDAVDELVVMSRGRVVTRGPTAEVLGRDDVRRLLGGVAA